MCIALPVQSLSFDFRVSGAIASPWAWAALLIDGADGKSGTADLSKYSTVTFLAKCAPANSLVFNAVTLEESVAKRGKKLTHLPVMTYFSCNEKGMPVSDAGLDLDGVAAGTGTNRNKINEVLKTELGMTFTGYLKKLRLTEAARLLTDKAGATVAEIAYSVGYANRAHFNKIFKEEYGCSSRQFRNVAARSETPAEHEPTRS